MVEAISFYCEIAMQARNERFSEKQEKGLQK